MAKIKNIFTQSRKAAKTHAGNEAHKSREAELPAILVRTAFASLRLRVKFKKIARNFKNKSLREK
ncbi:hypothetical protein HYN59_08145 [Flavobacterium album]|uniref:Uncharacterized protein n=1 Tax=Flavobacterium album TaxID=2175091 RepID=A0A2S1QXH3_9FLAO|nr:hypothetical protein [Flavobacterium album]AWH85098.1 hypothetical protein HYN59_08145 [Flavobacterium album]